jgi:pyrimidine-nucleoside phosphorylase
MELVYLQADALGYDISQFIKDGSALKEFNAMCVRQGVEQGIADQLCSDPWSVLQCGKNTTHIRATKEGYVSDIDALALGEVLCVIGAGRTGINSIIDHGIGAVLNKIIGSKVAEGEPVITIDSPGTIPSELKNKLLGAITISDQEVELKPRLIATIYSD